jgi:hypothetical protein
MGHMSAPDDIQDAARSGGAEAFEQLVGPYRGELLAHCYRIATSARTTPRRSLLAGSTRGKPTTSTRSSPCSLTTPDTRCLYCTSDTTDPMPSGRSSPKGHYRRHSGSCRHRQTASSHSAPTWDDAAGATYRAASTSSPSRTGEWARSWRPCPPTSPTTACPRACRLDGDGRIEPPRNPLTRKRSLVNPVRPAALNPKVIWHMALLSLHRHDACRYLRAHHVSDCSAMPSLGAPQSGLAVGPP